ncbi:CRISPR-associated helicase/endonuclease Cas3 [Thermococcus sp. 5-4]|uniref:CRISPR-associated helicase/endonuclease Cas3 n=1 Tax=Thermococcus sp. 5-4 TaxID=2008440 RepID=UPI000B49B137|nr:CRISPR-associated helicase/endonuclease Cas3 [Thermococcus sp. 5-4]ASA77163.1 CRISPR-associated helicase/endonuclease Cas3 [Thermococcus sp. 5-4]
MGVRIDFQKATGFSPYTFQREAMQSLTEGSSLIVRAPTGSGKSEMVLIPFIFEINENLPSQMIYSLPNRTLVESIGERARRYASYKKLRVAVHHGKRPESSLFEEDVIVATIDQTAGAYLSVPLSMPKRWGNIFLGAAGSAMLVFDEVHTLHPEKGLLTSVAMSIESAKLGIPFVMMSATLPRNFMERVKALAEKKGGKVEIIEVEDEQEVKSRAKRRVEVNTDPLFSDTPLTVKEIERQAEDIDKLIVVVNTVGKAQQLYRELKAKADRPVVLIHSRFLEEDRSQKEAKVREIFGKGSSVNEVILISTQVIEVGMDISSTKLLTEISPADSLIQRAGRVARWGGEGEIVVYNVEKKAGNPYAPYSKKLVESTIDALMGVELLDWQTEIGLVEKVLSKPFENYLDPYKFYERLGGLARAVYEGKRSYVEENVREAYSVDITIYDDVSNLNPDDTWRLKRLRIDFRVLKGKFDLIQEAGGEIYRVEENFIIDEYESKYTLVPVSDKDEIVPFEFYVITGISYSPELGLLFDGSGNVKRFEFEERDKLITVAEKDRMKKESWVEHSRKTLNVLRVYMLPRYDYPIGAFAKYFGISKNELTSWIELSVALHDLGKLNLYWQKKAGWKEGEEPIAHGFEMKGKLPPHATVSAKALERFIGEHFEDRRLAKVFYLAIAHHHSPWSSKFQKFKLIPNVMDYILQVYPLKDIENSIIYSHPAGSLGFNYLNIAEENEYYRLYGLVSKLLRISDRLATGGESYESIFNS